MFDYPPKVHKQDLNHITYLLNNQIKRFLDYEIDDCRDLRGMIRMVEEVGYKVTFEAKLTKR